ncbi:MAG: glutamate 5-kinase [Acidimicrobiales bacterium]
MTRRIVVKIGTASITAADGSLDASAIEKTCEEVLHARQQGHDIVVVTSAAITAGLPMLGIERPSDSATLQAVAAVGQIQLMNLWFDGFAQRQIVAGQVLLAPLDFMVRQQYLHARQTVTRLLALNVVPVVNENDAIADDEIRFGDNDRLAALVAQLVDADTLVLLTDAPGLLTADPRLDPNATLIEDVASVDAELEALAGGVSSDRGSGGMASKLAAAKMAAWSGVRTVIASADRENVVIDAIAGANGVGTTIQPKEQRMSARKVWIAFAVASKGRIEIDAGARKALEAGGRSLLPAGVRAVVGKFEAGATVEVVDGSGDVFARGIVGLRSEQLDQVKGRHTSQLPAEVRHEVIHCDDLVMLP